MKPYVPSLLLSAELEGGPLLDEALQFCAERLRRPESEVRRALRGDDQEAHSTLRYAIAKGLSVYLARIGGGIYAVYLYGSAMKGEARPFSDIDLLVLVDRKLDQVRAFLGRVDLALVTAYRSLLGTKDDPASLLDIHLVDVGEEEARQGYGALVGSARISPVCLWRVTPKVSGAPMARSPRTSVTERG
jgi:predicted nucleotidyltransferase